VPGHCLSAEDGAINQTEKDSCLHWAYSLERK
jgi:hypothetical protein